MNANYVTKAEREKEVKEKKRKPARTKKNIIKVGELIH